MIKIFKHKKLSVFCLSYILLLKINSYYRGILTVQKLLLSMRFKCSRKEYLQYGELRFKFLLKEVSTFNV